MPARFARLFLGVVFVSLLLPARANLGESVEQCVARYGRPVGYSEANAKNPFGTVAFAAGGYTLVVFVYQDKELGARVSKKDKAAFTDAEVQNIMAADGLDPASGPSRPAPTPPAPNGSATTAPRRFTTPPTT